MLPSSGERMPEELRESEIAAGDPQDQQPIPSLEALVANGMALHDAMEYFLLLNPREQVAQLGEPEDLKRTADEARASGDKILARIDYECAAKIALYRQRRDMFLSMLSPAEKVTPPNQRFSTFHRVLMRESDAAFRIAKDFYSELEHLQDKSRAEEEYVPPVGD